MNKKTVPVEPIKLRALARMTTVALVFAFVWIAIARVSKYPAYKLKELGLSIGDMHNIDVDGGRTYFLFLAQHIDISINNSNGTIFRANSGMR